MYYKDDFNVTFEEESAFYKYLDDVEKRAEWFRAQSKDLTVEAVTKDSTCTCLLYTSPSPRDTR